MSYTPDGVLSALLAAGTAVGLIGAAIVTKYGKSKRDQADANQQLLEQVAMLWKKVNELQVECESLRETAERAHEEALSLRREHHNCRVELDSMHKSYEALQSDFTLLRLALNKENAE